MTLQKKYILKYWMNVVDIATAGETPEDLAYIADTTVPGWFRCVELPSSTVPTPDLLVGSEDIYFWKRIVEGSAGITELVPRQYLENETYKLNELVIFDDQMFRVTLDGMTPGATIDPDLFLKPIESKGAIVNTVVSSEEVSASELFTFESTGLWLALKDHQFLAADALADAIDQDAIVSLSGYIAPWTANATWGANQKCTHLGFEWTYTGSFSDGAQATFEFTSWTRTEQNFNHGAWTDGTLYMVGDVVIDSGNTYKVTTDHVSSGSFNVGNFERTTKDIFSGVTPSTSYLKGDVFTVGKTAFIAMSKFTTTAIQSDIASIEGNVAEISRDDTSHVRVYVDGATFERYELLMNGATGDLYIANTAFDGTQPTTDEWAKITDKLTLVVQTGIVVPEPFLETETYAQGDEVTFNGFTWTKNAAARAANDPFIFAQWDRNIAAGTTRGAWNGQDHYLAGDITTVAGVKYKANSDIEFSSGTTNVFTEDLVAVETFLRMETGFFKTIESEKVYIEGDNLFVDQVFYQVDSAFKSDADATVEENLTSLLVLADNKNVIAANYEPDRAYIPGTIVRAGGNLKVCHTTIDAATNVDWSTASAAFDDIGSEVGIEAFDATLTYSLGDEVLYKDFTYVRNATVRAANDPFSLTQWDRKEAATFHGEHDVSKPYVIGDVVLESALFYRVNGNVEEGTVFVEGVAAEEWSLVGDAAVAYEPVKTAIGQYSGRDQSIVLAPTVTWQDIIDTYEEIQIDLTGNTGARILKMSSRFPVSALDPANALALSTVGDSGLATAFFKIDAVTGSSLDLDTDSAWVGNVDLDIYGIKGQKTVVNPNDVEVDLTDIEEGDRLVWNATDSKFEREVSVKSFDASLTYALNDKVLYKDFTYIRNATPRVANDAFSLTQWDRKEGPVFLSEYDNSKPYILGDIVLSSALFYRANGNIEEGTVFAEGVGTEEWSLVGDAAVAYEPVKTVLGTHTGTDFADVLDPSMTWQDIIDTYEEIQLDFSGDAFSRSLRMSSRFPVSAITETSTLAISTSGHAGSGSAFYEIDSLTGRGLDLNYNTAWINTPEVVVYGIKGQKTVINPNDVEVDLTDIEADEVLIWDAVNSKFIRGGLQHVPGTYVDGMDLKSGETFIYDEGFYVTKSAIDGTVDIDWSAVLLKSWFVGGKEFNPAVPFVEADVYVQGDVVTIGGFDWIKNATARTGGTPFSPDDFDRTIPAPYHHGEFTAFTIYLAGDTVTYSGKVYSANANMYPSVFVWGSEDNHWTHVTPARFEEALSDLFYIPDDMIFLDKAVYLVKEKFMIDSGAGESFEDHLDKCYLISDDTVKGLPVYVDGMSLPDKSLFLRDDKLYLAGMAIDGEDVNTGSWLAISDMVILIKDDTDNISYLHYDAGEVYAEGTRIRHHGIIFERTSDTPGSATAFNSTFYSRKSPSGTEFTSFAPNLALLQGDFIVEKYAMLTVRADITLPDGAYTPTLTDLTLAPLESSIVLSSTDRLDVTKAIAKGTMFIFSDDEGDFFGASVTAGDFAIAKRDILGDVMSIDMFELHASSDEEIPSNWVPDTSYDSGMKAIISDALMVCTTIHTSSSNATPTDVDLSNWVLVNRKTDGFRLTFTGYVAAGTNFDLAGTDGTTAIPGATAAGTLPTDNIQTLLSLGYRFALDGSDVTSLVVPDGTDPTLMSLDAFIDNEMLEVFVEIQSEGTVNFKQSTDVTVTTVTADVDLIPDNKGQVLQVTGAHAVRLMDSASVGESWTIVNRSGGQLTITTEGGNTLLGEVNIANDSAISVIVLAAGTAMVIGGVV